MVSEVHQCLLEKNKKICCKAAEIEVWCGGGLLWSEHMIEAYIVHSK